MSNWWLQVLQQVVDVYVQLTTQGEYCDHTLQCCLFNNTHVYIQSVRLPSTCEATSVTCCAISYGGVLYNAKASLRRMVSMRLFCGPLEIYAVIVP